MKRLDSLLGRWWAIVFAIFLMTACGNDERGESATETETGEAEVDEGGGAERNVEVIRRVKLALDSYAADKGGKYPDALSALADAEELEDTENPLKFVAADGTESSWKYVRGLSQSDEVGSVILYAPVSEGGKRLMCTLAGRSVPVSEAAFQAAMAAQGVTVEEP